jgi:hypothetical protein
MKTYWNIAEHGIGFILGFEAREILITGSASAECRSALITNGI